MSNYIAQGVDNITCTQDDANSKLLVGVSIRDVQLCQGRLTLTSGTAITTADVTGATNVYFTPFKGNLLALYTSSKWVIYQFTELTLALGTITSGLPYDVFVYDSGGGTLVLEKLAWSSGTARATALTTQDGIYVKTGETNKRYLGTFYTTSTTTTEDSSANRYLWNYYNRVQRKMKAVDAMATWSYNVGTWRQANGNSANQLNFVIGVQESFVRAEVNCAAEHTIAGDGTAVGIALDATNTTNSDVASTMLEDVTITNTGFRAQIARYEAYPAIGKHFLAWVERASAASTSVMAGTTGDYLSGILGSLDA